MIALIRRHPLPAVFLLALLLLLPGIGALPLIDRDEPRFAQATVEMMHRHEWIVPYFNGGYRFDKPVLVYWLMRAGYALLGVGEAGARLHTVLAGAALAALLFDTGRRWFSEKAGWVAAAGFLACLQVQIHGRLCLADMPMVLCVTLVCRMAYELLHPENNDAGAPYPWRKWWTLWLAMGVGFLAKGPVVIAVPALALVLHRWVFARAPLPWARLRAAPGLALALATLAPWGLAALWSTHGLFWKVGMGEHVVSRGVDGLGAQKPGSVLFYLATIFLSLYPAFAYAGRVALAATLRGEPRRAWLLSWFLAPVVIFSLYAAKLPHYILPGFPAFFLMLGAWAATPAGERSRRGLLWQRFLFSAYALVAGVIALLGLALWTGVAAMPGVYATGLRDFGAAAFHLAGALAGAWLVTFGLSRVKPLRWIVPGALVLAASFAGFAHHFRKTSPAVALESALRSFPPDTRFVGTGFQEGTLVFYADRVWTFSEDPKVIGAELAKPGPVALLVLDERVRNERLLGAAFARAAGRETDPKPEDLRGVTDKFAAGFTERARFSGFSPGNGKWVTVRLLERP